MSDISILNILGGANASMEAGDTMSLKGQANVDIEALDPELVAKLPEALKENLATKKDLPTFEAMLLGEEEASAENLLGSSEQTLQKTQVPKLQIKTPVETEAETVPVSTKGQSEEIVISEAPRKNTDLLSALTKGAVSAKGIQKVQEVQASEVGALEVESLPVEQAAVEESGNVQIPTKFSTTKKVNTNPNLKLVSGEDFVSTKNLSVKEGAPEMMVSEESGDFVARQAELLTSRARAAQSASNPFMAQNTQLRGGLALSGAMFREALAADSSESEEATFAEKNSETRISGIEMKDMQAIDPALGLSARDQVSNTASAEKPVLNLSHIDARKTGDLIGEISNYIDRSRLESKGEIDVWVHHKDLGTFQVQAGKSTVPGQDNVNLKIETFSKEGQNFFNQNAPELVKHLQDSGVKVSDFQIKASSTFGSIAQSSESSNSQMGRDSNQQSNSGQSQSQSFAGQNQRQGSESGGDRRKQMWQHYQETYRQRFAS